MASAATWGSGDIQARAEDHVRVYGLNTAAMRIHLQSGLLPETILLSMGGAELVLPFICHYIGEAAAMAWAWETWP